MVPPASAPNRRRTPAQRNGVGGVSHLVDMLGVKDWLPDFRRGMTGQADGKRRAVFDGRSHVDSPAVRFGDFAGNVQSHSDAARAVIFRLRGTGAADERVEYPLQFARRN